MFRLTLKVLVIALFGTGLGLGVGTFLGWAMVRALADRGIDQLVVPTVPLAVIASIAGIAGVVAAILPARRAARIEIPSALSFS